ncbi:efflux RND transporter permease subunit [Mesorhizobium sp. C416B]|uniref:efflux RND transporter permease subunit n=1 Tax=unclassified Mesorhizobium TaxID=325217 RepID=UPI0012EC6E29|nr:MULTISPECIES: efflux RND transporter permease subunit [unclassified Mesorhizobium]WJI65880.1 efflux RND transporter permease subunit [Mesorhizobium sp. C416B]
MLFVMATILMIQLQSFQRLFLVVAVAPLGLIGVVAALVPSGAPLGFVAILGVLALIGILIRNSGDPDRADRGSGGRGPRPLGSRIEATEHRMRPIALTAAAASLALIPIAREVFWGPMAYAMMGGIIAGTAITLLFLPALYVTWFRIKEPKQGTNHLFRRTANWRKTPLKALPVIRYRLEGSGRDFARCHGDDFEVRQACQPFGKSANARMLSSCCTTS